MKFFIPIIFKNKLSKNYFLILLLASLFNGNLFAQQYPPSTTMSNVSYNPPTQLPAYLTSFNEENFGNKVTRISSLEVMGGDLNNLRHEYVTNQPWNADGTKIQLYKSGLSYILDGSTYEVLDGPVDVERYWSNVDPNKTYYFYANKFYTTNVISGVQTMEYDFSNDGFNWVSMGNGSGYLSNDDELVALHAKKPSGVYYIVVFNTVTKEIISSMSVGTTDQETVKISPSKQYVVVGGGSGSGPLQGTNVYDVNLNFLRHLYNVTPHSDVGVDIDGNDVWVCNDDNWIRTFRLDGVGNTSEGMLYNFVSGGHVSCRNINRPGWMYVTDHGGYSQPGDYKTYREIFAVKMDNKPNGQITVQRFTKHYSYVLTGYYHEPHAVPNQDGSKVMFASAMEDPQTEQQTYPFSWVVETQDSNSGGLEVSIGDDVSICEGESVTLTATGAQSYVWSNSETGNSITVSPTETTTYTVTGTDSNGNEATDSVIVYVNALPTANAGGDVEICEDSYVNLSASGGDSYQWSTGETSQSIVVSPQETTTYTVTVTQNQCTDTDDVEVLVKPRPTINAGNDVDIYHGESTTLTAVGDGVFEWSTGENTASITVNPTVNTTYVVTATLDGCTSTDDVLVSVTQPDAVEADAGQDITICQAESAVLTANGGNNYLWSTGETTQSIEVSPTETTLYNVTVFVNNNSDSDDVLVSVNSLPIANAGSDSSILFGESITLSASGGSEFVWNTGETTQNIVVNPTENETYSVEVFENGCSSTDSINVIVNVNASINDDLSICEGESTTLTASGGANYLWSTGETTQSISVNPSQSMTYSVVVSNETSSDEVSTMVNVNLIPSADAGEDDMIEAGQSITLSAAGGNSYVWSTGETTQHISVSPMETTTYTVETFISGCSNNDDVTISVVEPVDAFAGDDIETCLGEQITLTASGGQYFEWNTGDTTSSITVTPTATTIYTVSVSNGISTQSADVMVSLDNCLDNDNGGEFFSFDYKVYPNPSNGEVNIKLSGLENISSIYITDILGKTIKTETFNPNNGFIINKKYDFSSFSKGIYFVTFKQSSSPAITKKLILK